MQVGCMGFCMGGALSFLAGQEADVDAIAPFYGTPDPKLAQVLPTRLTTLQKTSQRYIVSMRKPKPIRPTPIHLKCIHPQPIQPQPIHH